MPKQVENKIKFHCLLCCADGTTTSNTIKNVGHQHNTSFKKEYFPKVKK
jgi:hypothetical protein